jgi:hypothetical protein
MESAIIDITSSAVTGLIETDIEAAQGPTMP